MVENIQTVNGLIKKESLTVVDAHVHLWVKKMNVFLIQYLKLTIMN